MYLSTREVQVSPSEFLLSMTGYYSRDGRTHLPIQEIAENFYLFSDFLDLDYVAKYNTTKNYYDDYFYDEYKHNKRYLIFLDLKTNLTLNEIEIIIKKLIDAKNHRDKLKKERKLGKAKYLSEIFITCSLELFVALYISKFQNQKLDLLSEIFNSIITSDKFKDSVINLDCLKFTEKNDGGYVVYPEFTTMFPIIVLYGNLKIFWARLFTSPSYPIDMRYLQLSDLIHNIILYKVPVQQILNRFVDKHYETILDILSHPIYLTEDELRELQKNMFIS